MTLKSIIENSDTPAGRRFDFAIQILIVFSLISFSVETLPNIGEGTKKYFNLIEIITIIIFTIEYLLRIVISDKKLKFVFSFYGLIDLLAILPFYLSTGIDLRSIRILRLFRLIRAFKLLRYSIALQRFHRALIAIKEELILFSILTLILLYFSAVGIYYFENSAQPKVFSSIFHSLWWAVATLTTVGYGDVYPITIGGKILTFIILMIGLGVVAVPTGLLASALSSNQESQKEDAKASQKT